MTEALKSHKLSGQLTVSERKNILHAVIDFIVEKYGHYPKQEIKKDVANVLVSLFPCLAKTNGDSAIVSNLKCCICYSFLLSNSKYFNCIFYSFILRHFYMRAEKVGS